MMVERYLNLKEKTGGLIPGRESPLYLTENLSGGQLPHVFWSWHLGVLSQKEKKNK